MIFVKCLNNIKINLQYLCNNIIFYFILIIACLQQYIKLPKRVKFLALSMLVQTLIFKN